jgi:outer membrane receptor protein involved in Fe transport
MSSWHARLGASWRWAAETWNVPLAVQSYSRGGYPAVLLPSYSVIDLNAQISRGPLTLRLFARNVADRRADLNAFAVLGNEGMPLQIDHILLQPRTLGIGVEYAF